MSRLLVPNPEERLTMNGIKCHPWFLSDLPPGAMEMNDMLLHDPTTMEEVRNPLCCCSITHSLVCEGASTCKALHSCPQHYFLHTV